MRWVGWIASIGAAFSLAALAQTTNGLISGRITDSAQGTPVKSANVFYWSAETNTSGAAATDNAGTYVLPLLSPGIYRVRAEAAGYQAKEIQELEVPVSGRLGLDFQLRPLADVWEAGIFRSLLLPGSKVIVTYYGPDVDESKAVAMDTRRSVRGALETTISHVIFPEEVQHLPLSARDVYAALVMEPGVTTDISTGRGLGLAVNGQRATASNFLLDGIENNDALVTGPLNIVPPEAVQEYRISTNNFSAEFGRTSGYIADAVTRGGGAAWHGLLYYYLENEALNANDFSRNLRKLPRAKSRDVQPGFSIGGPLLKDRLFFALSGEFAQFVSRAAPAKFRLPTLDFYTLFHQSATVAPQLLNRFPAPLAPIDKNTGTELATIERPSDLNRYIVLPRFDYLLKGGAHRFMARAIVANVNLPDFIWTPFQDFITPLQRTTTGIAGSGTSMIRPNLTNEARFGWNSDSLTFDRRWPDIPTLVSFDVSNPLWLPGSPAFYGFHSDNQYEEFQDNLIWVRGAHVMKFGGGVLARQLQGTVDPGDFIVFQNFASFYLDQSRYFFAATNRLKPGTLDTDFARQYHYNQFYLFAEDSFKVNRRLALDYGVRYERFGAPVNTGATKDLTVQLGQGSSLAARIGGATLQPGPSGNQSLYDTDNKDFAVRAGFSLNLRNNGQTLLRGSYGIFYDRPFDNLWQTMQANNFYLGVFNVASRTNYLAPLSTILPAILASPNQTLKVPDLTLYQPDLKNGRVQSFFLGVQHELTNSFLVEVNATGSLGRHLITTDVLNRSPAPTAFGQNEFNNNLPTLSYRSSQGSSSYTGFTALGRYRSDRLQGQVAYTLSHAIDNQSDPLRGGFFNFLFTGGKDDNGQPLGGTILNQLLQGGVPSPVAAFTREFDSHGDRANSDFDQRHNLVGYLAYQTPRFRESSKLSPLWNGWAISMLGAVRSGFPYTVFAPNQSGGLIYNNTANLIGNPYLNTPATGGRILLNSAAFQQPLTNVAGNTGRNEFRGPGVASMDLSLSRSFGLRWLGEGGRLTLRADAYNFLNHANLNNPAASLTNITAFQKTFGVANFGRQDARSGFPSSIPLDETSRQIQLMVRLNF
ncbi:MAG TPA: carboxypeptidase-like regulatory domain-containing protein [Bryobacteraceae bacterium]|nr:carboxypeptidase-like regulatory domain-containing protein [Bryobacteraceae bacterium]